MYLEYIKKEYKLEGVVIIDLTDIMVSVYTIIDLIKSNLKTINDIDTNYVEISSVIDETVNDIIKYDILEKTYCDLFTTLLWNKSRIVVILSKYESSMIQEHIENIVNFIYKKLYTITKASDYHFITESCEVMPDDKLYLMSNIDTINLKAATFEFYRSKRSGR